MIQHVSRISVATKAKRTQNHLSFLGIVIIRSSFKPSSNAISLWKRGPFWPFFIHNPICNMVPRLFQVIHSRSQFHFVFGFYRPFFAYFHTAIYSGLSLSFLPPSFSCL